MLPRQCDGWLACTEPQRFVIPFGTTTLRVECHDAAVADESDDGAGERDVLTNLPRTRPARRSSRRAPVVSEAEAAPAPTPKPRAKPVAKPAGRRAPAKGAAKPPKAATKPTAAKRSPARPTTGRRAAPKPAAPRPASTTAAMKAPEQAAPPLPSARPEHRSPLTDMAVTSIELSGALFHMGMDITRSILRSTVGRVPRP
jgi:hypothetical protein